MFTEKDSILAQTKPVVDDATPAERALGPQLIDDPVDEMFKRLAQQSPVNTTTYKQELKKFHRKQDESVTVCYFRFRKMTEQSKTDISQKELAVQFLPNSKSSHDETTTLNKEDYDLEDVHQGLEDKEKEDFTLRTVDERFVGTRTPTGPKSSSDDLILEDNSEEDEDHPPLLSYFQDQIEADNKYNSTLKHYPAAVAMSDSGGARDPLKRGSTDIRHKSRTGTARYPASFKVIDIPGSELTPLVVSKPSVPAQTLLIYIQLQFSLKDIDSPEESMIEVISNRSVMDTNGTHGNIATDSVLAAIALTKSDNGFGPCRPPKGRSAEQATVATLYNTDGVVTVATKHQQSRLLFSWIQPILISYRFAKHLRLSEEDIKSSLVKLKTATGGSDSVVGVTNARFSAVCLITRAITGNVLLGTEFLIPLGFGIDFMLRPQWRSSGTHKVTLPLLKNWAFTDMPVHTGTLDSSSSSEDNETATDDVHSGQCRQGQGHIAEGCSSCPITDCASSSTSTYEAELDYKVELGIHIIKPVSTSTANRHLHSNAQFGYDLPTVTKFGGGQATNASRPAVCVPRCCSFSCCGSVDSKDFDHPHTAACFQCGDGGCRRHGQLFFNGVINWTLPPAGIVLVEVFGGTANGLRAVLQSHIQVARYIYVDSNPEAREAAAHHLDILRQQHPNLLTPATNQWDSLLPQTFKKLPSPNHSDGFSALGSGRGFRQPSIGIFLSLVKIMDNVRARQLLPFGCFIENVEPGETHKFARFDFQTICDILGPYTILDAAILGSLAIAREFIGPTLPLLK
eukprot:SM000028S10147  [mRNA]  locus=s28:645431:648364:+ [translate_table: standard]